MHIQMGLDDSADSKHLQLVDLHRCAHHEEWTGSGTFIAGAFTKSSAAVHQAMRCTGLKCKRMYSETKLDVRKVLYQLVLRIKTARWNITGHSHWQAQVSFAHLVQACTAQSMQVIGSHQASTEQIIAAAIPASLLCELLLTGSMLPQASQPYHSWRMDASLLT